MTQRSSLRTGALVALVLGFGTVASAQDTQALVKEAFELTARGKNDEALAKLNEVLATDPTAEVALDLRNVLEARQWIDISIASEKLGEVVTVLFGRAMPAAAAKTGDPEAIDALIAEARSGADWAAKEKALRSLALNHGEYAATRLWTDLAAKDGERRAQTIDWLRRLGAESSLPLIQCLKSGDPMIRANAATALGMIGDVRAIPQLTAAASDGEEIVRSAAQSSLKRLGSTGASTVEAGVALARKYYRRDPTAVNHYRVVFPVWTMVRTADSETLTAHEVPRDLYHLKLAEGVLFDTLRTQPDHEAGRVLLASVLLAQAEFGRGVVAEGDGAAVAAACAQSRALAAAQGPEILSMVAASADREGRHDVAAAAVSLLGSISDANTHEGVAGLATGLYSMNKNVRYAAALALAEIRASGAPMNDVVDTLAQAVGEDAVRNVLVIDDVTETREAICRDLDAKKYFCAWNSDGATGVVRLRDYPIEDLVIVRYDLKRGHVANVVGDIRRDERTKDVPVVLLVNAADMDAAKKEWDGKVQGFITGPPVADAYEPELKALAPTLDPARESATATAAKAASALAAMDAAMIGSARGALEASLKGDDRVRTPAVKALGKIADPASEAALLELLRDGTAAEPVRGEAAKALARISRKAGATSPEFGGALREAAMKGGTPELVQMLSEAAGLLPLAPATRLGAMRMGRPASTVDLVK